MDQDHLHRASEFLQSNNIIPRSAWGARDSRIADRPDNLDWDYNTVVVHHSGRSGQTDPKKIQNKHMDTNHWDDVGYHFMIGPSGQIYEGRQLVYKGSHTEGANTGKIGVLVMGNFEREFLGLLGGKPSPSQILALKKLVTDLKKLFLGLKTLGGHKDFKATTECPGNQLYPLLPEIRQALGMQAPPPL
jgi:hypothetical protein